MTSPRPHAADPAAAPAAPPLSADDLPTRRGPAPPPSHAIPHEQRAQNAPPAMQDALFARAAALPGVVVDESQVSVPGTRAFYLEPRAAGGPRAAFLMGGEFAHLHPAYDGSLHLTLPPAMAAAVVRQGWGEPHPLAARAGGPPGLVMVYGPRDAGELDVVWGIVRASYDYARGSA